MAKITISDLHPAELEENSQLTTLSLKEIAAMSGGGLRGALVGALIGSLGGPVGALIGAGVGSIVEDLL